MSEPVLKARSGGYRFKVDKRVPLAGETDFERGFTTVEDGYVVAELEVIVDVEKLLYAVGRRSVFSKLGLTKLQGGAVIVRCVSKKRYSKEGTPC